MKIKKSNKKLVFSKDTVADLDVEDLNDVRGGGTTNTIHTHFHTCTLTCWYTCGNTCYQAPGTDCLVPAF